MGKAQKIILNTKPKVFGAAAGSLLLSYVFASLAIDTAYYWQYLLAIIFLVLSIKLFIRSFRIHGNK